MQTIAELVGGIAAVITTLCWLPQARKILREKRTEGISLAAQAALTLGVLLWLIYGLMLDSLPLIGSNAISLGLVALVLALKIRYG
jgi:MtN3 and saliva related transmembrane protein